MALTRKQFEELRNKGLSVEQIVAFERGEKPADLQRSAQVKQETAGNQFEQEKPTSFLGKARDFATNIIGGGKTAVGAGMAAAAPGVQKGLSEEQNQTFEMQNKILSQIRTAKAEGRDTTRLETALKKSKDLVTSLDDAQSDFVGALPSTKEVVGSSTRLAGTMAGGALARGAAQATGVGAAKTFGQGALRGGGAGALAGAAEGGIQGLGYGMEQNMTGGQTALSTATGVLGGAALGGTLGAIGGGFIAKMRGVGDPELAIDKITPRAADLTPGSYQELLNRGRITPRTLTSEPRVILSGVEKQAATKYQHLINDDPVQTVLSINDKIGDLDEEVGTFLRENNGIFNKGELKNVLTNALKDIDDITLSESRLSTAKSRLVTKFVDSLKQGDYHSLWVARKEYDEAIDAAFRGSPTVSKAIKISLRNAVQDFIKNGTPSTVYSDKMKDMTGLFKLRDLAGVIAKKERGLARWGAWARANPLKAQVVSTAAIGGAGLLGYNQFLSRGSSIE